MKPKRTGKLRELWAAGSDRAAGAAFKAAARIFNLLPAADACRLGAGLGRLWLFCDRRHRRVVVKNLEMALGLAPESREMARMLRATAEHLGCNLAEILLLHAGGPGGQLLQRNMQLRGLERLRREVEKEKGVIIVSAHFGNWEMAGLVADRLGREVATVGKPIKGKPRLYREITKTREKSGFKLLEKSGSAGALARRLRKGGVIALLVDQRVRRKYRIFAEFFGHQVPTSPAPAMLARLSGSPIIPVFTRRLTLLHHDIVIGEPFFVPTTGNSREIITEYTNRINRIIEQQIRATPEQWFWPHDRWRRIESKTLSSG
jgi:KDO2-lipid IV(A) lauroyltransferase